MHFYPFNIGDYATATAHLEPLEDLAYRRLMDLYYSSESPIPESLEKTARLIRMRTHSDCIAIVLDEFFTLEDDGYHCDRIDVELFKFHEKSEKASKSAKARWKKAKVKQRVKASCERIANAEETHSEGNAKQELRTKNQEPVNTNINTLVEPEVKPSKFKFDAYHFEFAERMLSQFRIVNPGFKQPNLDSWANTLRLMIDVDKRDPVMIGKVFTWANQDSFWSSNILSAAALRKQFDKLIVKVNQPTQQQVTTQQSNDLVMDGFDDVIARADAAKQRRLLRESGQ